MEMGSKFAYISKRKMGIVSKARKEKPKREEEEGFDSCEEVMDEAMDDFMGPKGKAAPMMAMPESSAMKPPSMAYPGYAPPPSYAPKPHSKEEEKKKNRDEVDTNVVSIKLGTLEHVGQLATGEPFFCAQCSAVLSNHSKSAIVKDEATKKSIWTCEFCNFKNELLIEEEEIPKVDTITYLIEKVVHPVSDAVVKEKEPTEDDISIVFCIDVSGSMDAAKFSKDGKPMKYVKNKNYPTRLEGVKVAIDNQIEQLTKTNPRRKIGFVTFENKVTLIGDGTQPPIAFEGTKLDASFFSLLEEAVNYSGTHMGKPIAETSPLLMEKLKAIRTGGSTALGPGLIVALAMAAQGKPGSRVIICTDGLANKGSGSVEGMSEKAAYSVKEFYTQAAEYAKQHGVLISLVTLVESECRLDMLSPVANLTGGDILRVDPMNLSADFTSFLAEKVIATNVEVKVKIHKGLNFRNEPEKNLGSDKTTLRREAGNATRESIITFEYCMKKPHELALIPDIDWEKLEKLPFQSQISYKTLDGKKCLKVITQLQDITHEKEEAKKGVDANVLGAHAAISAAQMAEKGDYKKAKAKAFLYSNWAPEPEKQEMVREKVGGLYQAVKMQEMAHAPQMDSLTFAINKAYNAKK